jgi:hypothetical protein
MSGGGSCPCWQCRVRQVVQAWHDGMRLRIDVFAKKARHG